jgi:hypothetical protein
MGKYKVKDLAMLLQTPEGMEALKRRVELMDLTGSTFRSQWFDAEEDFVRDTISFQGVPEVLYIMFMLISSMTGYPITRLFGVSPAGMNSTGESDMNNYYDMVRSTQIAELQPVLLRLVRIISQALNLPEPYIQFRPLETMNEDETAELEKKKADTEKVKTDTYVAEINAGMLEPYEARWLKYKDTLDDIPVPKEFAMPPVPEPAPEDPEPPTPEEEPEKGKNGKKTDRKDGQTFEPWGKIVCDGIRDALMEDKEAHNG